MGCLEAGIAAVVLFLVGTLNLKYEHVAFWASYSPLAGASNLLLLRIPGQPVPFQEPRKLTGALGLGLFLPLMFAIGAAITSVSIGFRLW